VSYNFGCRALHNLPWLLSVNSNQVHCNNIPTIEALLKKCVGLPVSWTIQEVQQCMVARFDAGRLFLLVFVLVL